MRTRDRMKSSGARRNARKKPNPSSEGGQPLVPRGSIVPEKKTFSVRCEPRNPRYSPIGAGGFSAYVGQRIRNKRVGQIWDSVVIHGDEEPDGTLAVRVLITNPGWSSSLQIACVRSRPDGADPHLVFRSIQIPFYEWNRGSVAEGAAHHERFEYLAVFSRVRDIPPLG